MSRYRDTVTEEAKKVLDRIAATFEADEEEHGGKSARPNLALWLDRTGALAEHVGKIAKGWAKKDLLWVSENSRHRVSYGSPQDNAYGAFYKDILLELKKLMKKRRGGE